MSTKEIRIAGPKELIDQVYKDHSSLANEFQIQVSEPRPKSVPTRSPLLDAAAGFFIAIVVDLGKSAAYQLWLEDYIERMKKKGSGNDLDVSEPR